MKRALTALVALFCAIGAAAAGDSKYTRWAGDGLLLSGYDTTAYFSHGKPIKGESGHIVDWNSGTWRFATAGEANRFRANPAAFAPQFGAYCTGGLSSGHVVNGNPKVWRLYQGKLYMFFAEAGGRRFDKDPDGVIARARAYAAKVGIVENDDPNR